MKNLANSITLTRPLLALSLFFFVNNTSMFIFMYSLCWFTDLIDGPIARRTNTQSELGSKLDDLGDYTTTIVLVVILTMWLGSQMLTFLPLVAGVFFFKFLNLGITKYKYGKGHLIHTYLAKFLAVVIFALPIVYLLTGSLIMIYAALIVGIVSALEETVIHLRAKEFNPNKKSLFFDPKEDPKSEDAEKSDLRIKTL